MPFLTRLYARSALVYLVAALLAAAVHAADKVAALPALAGTLRPVYLHLFMVGWVTQLIFGVMHWMFPKSSREHPRGREGLIWGVYVALNLGLLLRVISEPSAALGWPGPWGAGLAASAVLQWAAGVGFIVNTWPRVKER